MQKRRKLFFEEEKKKNFTQWYFNNEREIFDKCNEYFKICNETNYDNCLFYKNDNFYLYTISNG